MAAAIILPSLIEIGQAKIGIIIMGSYAGDLWSQGHGTFYV